MFDKRSFKKMKNQINRKLSELCRQGLEEGVFCGVSAAVSVTRHGVRSRSWFSGGRTRSDAHGQPVKAETFFDLASLTKPLCTTLCVLHLLETGQMRLCQSGLPPLAPDLEPEKEAITIRHLLQHSSGLPAYQPYFAQFNPRQSPRNKGLLLEKIIREPIDYPLGSTCVYSDLGFMLLGWLIEHTTATRLDHLFSTVITEPLQISSTLRFRPLNETWTDEHTGTIAATEKCLWRQRLLQGEVHDEHCWLMGGVAGHAGLFGTIEAVMRLCERLLDIWKGRNSHPAFANALLREALTRRHQSSSWCLGFDTPTPGRSSSGHLFSAHSVGHLGFSGTSFWIDPEQEVIIVLLTNRVHPSRENIKIRPFRPIFHDRLMETILAAS
ncbi:serine hydrolase domain-containing protein [Desulfobulbus propionicus]|nr:serine hydrolase domain-containing protein [Desulfobulbus propionicus]